jgi:hypothetical protein
MISDGWLTALYSDRQRSEMKSLDQVIKYGTDTDCIVVWVAKGRDWNSRAEDTRAIGVSASMDVYSMKNE